MSTTSTATRPAFLHIDGLDTLYVAPSRDGLGFDSHSTPDCPEVAGPAVATPKDQAGGWVCSVCVDVASTPRNAHSTNRGDSIDAPERGTGAGSSTNGPSENQLGFIARLLDEKGAAGAELRATFPERLTGGRHGTASALIDALLKLTSSTGAPEYRFRKLDGEWLVAGPAAAEGSTVTITKANGETRKAIVTADAGTARDGVALHRVREADKAPAAPARRSSRSIKAATFALKDRVVALTGAQTRDRAIRVCVPAAVLGVEDQPDAAYLVSWSYAFKGAERHTGGPGAVRTIPVGEASAIKLIDHLLALPDAEFIGAQVAYGQHFHECGRCGSPLSDKDSKARGLGPDCAKMGA